MLLVGKEMQWNNYWHYVGWPSAIIVAPNPKEKKKKKKNTLALLLLLFVSSIVIQILYYKCKT